MSKSIPKETKNDPKAPAKDAPEADAETPPPTKRKWLMLVLVVVLVLGGVGGCAWYFLRDHALAADAKEGAVKTAKAAPGKPPVFVTLEPFTVNLQHDDSSPQYLQVGLSLKVIDADSVEAIKLRMPEIRNRVLLLLSGKKASDISTPDGKQALSTELAREITVPLNGAVPAQAVDSVLFTTFVIQ